MVNCTFCRLVAKSAVSKVREELTSLLAPRQLRFGMTLGFNNAFNSLRRDNILLVVCELALALYPFAHPSYSSPSSLF